MKDQEEKSHFTIEEIKEKFKVYMEPGQFVINEDEFNIFCRAISILPMVIVNKIENEIYFITSKYACYINLGTKDLKCKKGIIFINPDIFKIQDVKFKILAILHEVAHHILGHKDINNLEEEKQLDIAAYAKADKWWNEYYGN